MESDDESKPAIVIDPGSCFFKAGFGGKDEPKFVFKTCVGYSNSKNKYFIGRDAEAKKEDLSKINYPIKQGFIENWDDMENILNNMFIYELQVDPSEHNIIFTQQLMNPKDAKECLAQIMFETFNVPGFYLEYSTLCSLYASGKWTGVSIELGGDTTQICPFVDCKPKPYSFEKLYYGGNAITDYLFSLFNYNSKMFYNSKYKSCMEDIKEKSCYVALDFEDEFGIVDSYDYLLPDNENLVVKEERFKAPEAIFKPSLLGKDEEMSLPQICNKLINKFNDEKKDLYNSIILSGGNSMFNGLPERLTKEMKALAKEDFKEEVHVSHGQERKFNSWIGASILANILKKKWITKEMYEESGISIIYKEDCLAFK